MSSKVLIHPKVLIVMAKRYLEESTFNEFINPVLYIAKKKKKKKKKKVLFKLKKCHTGFKTDINK